MINQNSEWIEEIIRISGSDIIHNIIDVGSNVGDVANLLVQRFPKSNLLCFEPCQRTYCTLNQKLASFDNVTCFPFALGSYAHEAVLHTYSNDLCNTLLPALNEPWHRVLAKESVNVVTLEHVAHLRNIKNIDILKIDVEGYELEVLKGAYNLLSTHRIRFIYAEVGFHKNKRHQYFSDLFDFLTALEYDLCGFYDAYKDGDKLQYTAFSNALFTLRPTKRRCASSMSEYSVGETIAISKY